MKLQGVVTNVANFGAFVDIGVHQDGLVHISELADRFVKDPREVVKAGQVVSVTVLEVDVARKRIALSMKAGARAGRGARDAEQGARGESRRESRGNPGGAGRFGGGRDARRSGGAGQSGSAGGTLLGDALARALKR
jgi:uncharacterized protein